MSSARGSCRCSDPEVERTLLEAARASISSACASGAIWGAAEGSVTPAHRSTRIPPKGGSSAASTCSAEPLRHDLSQFGGPTIMSTQEKLVDVPGFGQRQLQRDRIARARHYLRGNVLMTTCKKCQTVNEEGVFCRRCGAKLKFVSDRKKDRAFKREEKRLRREQERKRLQEEIDRQREEEVERARAKAEAKRYEEWSATDHGRASIMFDQGARFFQMQRVVGETKGMIAPMIGASSISSEADKSAASAGGLGSEYLNEAAQDNQQLPLCDALAVIENMGWTLFDVGYAFRQTHSESRDKFLASGQQIAVSGQIIGVYLFRRAAAVSSASETATHSDR